MLFSMVIQNQYGKSTARNLKRMLQKIANFSSHVMQFR